jgi:hypothetical protein
VITRDLLESLWYIASSHCSFVSRSLGECKLTHGGVFPILGSTTSHGFEDGCNWLIGHPIHLIFNLKSQLERIRVRALTKESMTDETDSRVLRLV